jgi:hypothetical protein
MSDSIHTSRAKFRKAFRFDYSTEEERTRVVGKIIDEVGLKRAVKANARNKKKAEKVGLNLPKVYIETKAAASKKSLPTEDAKQMVARHVKQGYGRSD